jgi:hypothetical protein
MSRIVLCWTLALLWTFLSNGCASSDANSMTGGVSFQLLYRGPEDAAAYYTLDRHGVLRFGGGMDAYLKKVSWQQQLSPQDIQQLEALIDQNQWFQAKPTATGEPPPSYEISLSGPQGSHFYRVKGQSPAIDPVLHLLDSFTRRRFDKYLEQFPQPGSQE